jgi:hypothetical protein
MYVQSMYMKCITNLILDLAPLTDWVERFDIMFHFYIVINWSMKEPPTIKVDWFVLLKSYWLKHQIWSILKRALHSVPHWAVFHRGRRVSRENGPNLGLQMEWMDLKSTCNSKKTKQMGCRWHVMLTNYSLFSSRACFDWPCALHSHHFHLVLHWVQYLSIIPGGYADIQSSWHNVSAESSKSFHKIGQNHRCHLWRQYSDPIPYLRLYDSSLGEFPSSNWSAWWRLDLCAR